MGNLAMKLPGKKLMYDAKTLQFTNSDEANKLLKRNPRDGWPDMPVT